MTPPPRLNDSGGHGVSGDDVQGGLGAERAEPGHHGGAAFLFGADAQVVEHLGDAGAADDQLEALIGAEDAEQAAPWLPSPRISTPGPY